MFPGRHAYANLRARQALLLTLLVCVLASAAAAAITLIDRSDAARQPRGVAAHGSISAAAPLTVGVGSTSGGPAFADGAVGLSIEAYELATPDLSAGRGSLVALMRLLGPGVLRIGGNSLDTSWWTSTNEPPPTWATSVVTPTDLVRLDGLLLATHWRVILGVDLGHLDPTRAADEAGFATRILGSGLLAFEVGNEPDLYMYPTSAAALRPATYNPEGYLQELAEYAAAMRTQAPALVLYGPDVSQPAWLPTIAVYNEMSFDVITEHFYPTTYSVASSACVATPVPSAADLISRRVRGQESAQLRVLIAVGKFAHRETRMSETNDTGSCDVPGGPATSPVFASALWALDWALRSASFGVTGINFHGYLGRCGASTFAPVCAATLRDEIRGDVSPRPEYYGLLAARQLEGGHFIGVKIRGATSLHDVTAYATLHNNGTITVAVENFSTTAAVAVALKVPGYTRAAEETLTAPSIHATQNVTFGGSAVTATGRWRPRPVPILTLNGRFRLRIAPASAWVVTLQR